VELSGYFAVARRWWWTLLVAAWVAGLAGYYVAGRIAPTYESSVQLLVGPINTDAATVGASAKLIQTYAQLATTDPVLGDALKEVGSDISIGLLASNTRVSANVDSRVLTIRVQAAEPQVAAALANGIAAVLAQRANAGLVRPEGQLLPIQIAVPNPNPVAPQVSLIVLLATAAGILAALILVLMIEYLSRTVASREELAKLVGAPVLGSVPAPKRSRPDARDLVDEGSSAANVYRVLAARIVFGDPDDVLHSMAIVDAESDTGSAVVAINLGRALARLGRRAVVIDSGSRSSLAELYGIDPTPGIREVLSREVQPRAAMRVVSDRLAIIPAGYEGGDAIDPDRARAVIQELLASADIVIVSTPPVQAGPGALSWARVVGRTVLVARRDHAHREDVEATAETLVHVGGSLIGAVMSERPAALSRLFGRGRSGSAKPVQPKPKSMASKVAPPEATPPTVASSAYRPSTSTPTYPVPPASYQPPVAAPPDRAQAPTSYQTPASSNSPAATPAAPVLAPSTIRPTVIRASAPSAPPPVAPPVVAEPAPTKTSSTTRSTTAKPRSTAPAKPRAPRSTTPKTPTDSH
jgi:polysaccharide biosynthesis transport protein